MTAHQSACSTKCITFLHKLWINHPHELKWCKENIPFSSNASMWSKDTHLPAGVELSIQFSHYNWLDIWIFMKHPCICPLSAGFFRDPCIQQSHHWPSCKYNAMKCKPARRVLWVAMRINKCIWCLVFVVLLQDLAHAARQGTAGARISNICSLM